MNAGGLRRAGTRGQGDAVLHGSWGVPHRSAEELQGELVTAGFTDPELDDLGYARIVRVVRP